LNKILTLQSIKKKMKKAGSAQAGQYVSHGKTDRPGIHSKCRTSNHKRSKNYKKTYKGQGR
jgi:hypothetical protein